MKHARSSSKKKNAKKKPIASKKKNKQVKKSSAKGRYIDLPLQRIRHINKTILYTLPAKIWKNKKNKKQYKKNFVLFRKKHFIIASRIFLVLGLLCFVVFFNLLIIRMFPAQKVVLSDNTSNKKIPVEITIPTVNIDVPLYAATYKNGTFDTTTQGASYLTTSPLPGDSGNSIIYAHNWWNLFGNLYKVKKGDTITVLFSDHSKKKFTVVSTQTVTAKQVSILHNTTDKRLTLFTCTDFLDADRFVVVAMLK